MLKDIHAMLLTGYVTVAHTQLLSDYMIDKREIYYFFWKTAYMRSQHYLIFRTAHPCRHQFGALFRHFSMRIHSFGVYCNEFCMPW